MQAAAISVRCNGPMGDEKAMKIYSFGEETKPAILLLPGTCCHWKRNFGHVIPLLQEHFYVLCASYDGFDETEDSTRSEERRVGKECRSRWSPYH